MPLTNNLVLKFALQTADMQWIMRKICDLFILLTGHSFCLVSHIMLAGNALLSFFFFFPKKKVERTKLVDGSRPWIIHFFFRLLLGV